MKYDKSIAKAVGSISVAGIMVALIKYEPGIIKEHFFGVFLFLVLAYWAVFGVSVEV